MQTIHCTPVRYSIQPCLWSVDVPSCDEAIGGVILTYRTSEASSLTICSGGHKAACLKLTASSETIRQLYALSVSITETPQIMFAGSASTLELYAVELCPASAVVTGTNPVIKADMPDPDIIRVDDTYYMVSTTMHNMPGCTILRSYDLIRWEIAANVYDTLPSTQARRMENGRQIYGQGMWAPSFRYHQGLFHITFSSNDTHCTYHYQAPSVDGPWRMNLIEGFYYDCSLFFDDDDRVFIVYGNNKVWLTELNADLTGPKSGGLHCLLLEYGNGPLGYEGSHLYKHDHRYVLFTIHSNRERWFREESCFTAEKLTDDFIGGVVLHDDMGYHEQGIAQGGMVDTPDGRWYCFFFQDRGASGRMPVLMPMHWENGRPVPGENGQVLPIVCNLSTRPDVLLNPFTTGDDFVAERIDASWQWNHEPSWEHIRVVGGALHITTDTLCERVTSARNVLTKRASSPVCVCEVTVSGKELKPGDFAGLCAFQSHYACIGIRRNEGGYAVEAYSYDPDQPASFSPAVRLPWTTDTATFRLVMDFEDMHDLASLYVLKGSHWHCLLDRHKMLFTLDHFTGNKAALFVMAEQETGGTAIFTHFTMNTYDSTAYIPR